jgi:TatD DNase family protein
MFVDTHAHLYAEEFKLDRDVVIDKAINNGIKKFYLPNIDEDSIAPMMELQQKFPQNCFPMMGLHPCAVKENVQDQLNLIFEWLDKDKFYAVGEIGIDLYWDKTFFEQQKFAFQSQVAKALALNLPVNIHCRNAFSEVYEVLKSFSVLPKAIFHCFSEGIDEAKKIIALGNFKLGIGGVVTFRNSG